MGKINIKKRIRKRGYEVSWGTGRRVGDAWKGKAYDRSVF